jgi:DNA-binding GntR family transcriptional regulator
MTMQTSFAIERRTLHDELVDHLRDMIVHGDLAPGSKIDEQGLCERFGVSRTPVREALRSLSAEGLVNHQPRRGATVAPMTLSDLEEAFPIIGALEGLAGELACAKVTDAEIARARDLQKKMEWQFAGKDREGYFASNEEIHRMILGVAANPTLTKMLRSLDGRVRRARYIANLSADRWAQAVAEHEQILAALAARDGAAMRERLTAHLANKFAALRRRLADMD